MEADNYKIRLKNEYFELNDKINRLEAMLECWDNGALEFEPVCPEALYKIQLNAMKTYSEVLEARMIIEDIK